MKITTNPNKYALALAVCDGRLMKGHGTLNAYSAASTKNPGEPVLLSLEESPVADNPMSVRPIRLGALLAFIEA